MTKSLSPYDLDKNLFCVEDLKRIDINVLVAEANRQLKVNLIKSKLEANGIDIELTQAKTGFRGYRFWFVCPRCGKRVGVLFNNPISQEITCRVCLKLLYHNQR